MVLTSAPIAEELVSILCELSERRHPELGRWCRTADAEAVRRAIIDRTDGLRKLLDQAVRLIRVAALVSRRHYTDFFYLDVPAVRPNLFKVAIESAARRGYLQPSLLEVAGDSVRLREPNMGLPAITTRGYELAYAQMPRAAILVDVLHNTLGYHVVAEAVSGLTVDGPAQSSARQISSDLRSLFNSWLAPRLENAHRRQQAKLLHAFLVSRNALRPDKIDDEVVFAFWQGRAEHWHAQSCRVKAGQPGAPADCEKAAQDEGFRVFRSAVKAIFLYRQALADAATASALEQATEPETIEAGSSTALDSLVWQSPLAALMRPPTDRVKWLTEKECDWLANYLGRGALPRGCDAGEVECLSEPRGGKAGLMEGRPFDLGLLRTLLRVDALAPIQARVIARLKRRLPRAAALASAIANAGDITFLEAVESYKRIRDQIEVEALATVAILAKAAEPMALLLIEQLGGPAATTMIRRLREQIPKEVAALPRRNHHQDETQDLSKVAQEELARIGLTLRHMFAGEVTVEDPLATLICRAAAARKRVRRTGFTADEALIPEIQRSLVLAVPAVVDLLSQLDRLIQRAEQVQPDRGFLEDRQRFLKVLELIYSEPMAEPPVC